MAVTLESSTDLSTSPTMAQFQPGSGVYAMVSVRPSGTDALQRAGFITQQLLLDSAIPLRYFSLRAGVEQILPARFAVAAIQNKEVTALAQSTVEDFLAHDVPGVSDVHTNKDDCNDLAVRVFNRLVLGDIALAEQQRQTAINLAPGDGSKSRAGGIQKRCPLPARRSLCAAMWRRAQSRYPLRTNR